MSEAIRLGQDVACICEGPSEVCVVEMLMVHSCGLYDRYKRQKDKPSVFMAQQLKVKVSKLKSRELIEDFYQDHDLIEAVREHKRKSVLDGKRRRFSWRTC